MLFAVDVFSIVMELKVLLIFGLVGLVIPVVVASLVVSSSVVDSSVVLSVVGPGLVCRVRLVRLIKEISQMLISSSYISGNE